MAAKKGHNNFSSYQAGIVDSSIKLIEVELNDARRLRGMNFGDIDALVRYISKHTGIYRTTLKRNKKYLQLLRDFLARQPGATSMVKIDDASPELLRAMIESRDMTIGNLSNQVRILNARISRLEQGRNQLTSPAVSTDISLPLSKVASPVYADAAFQDTAIALLQLIKHINGSTNSESIVIDEEENLILDMAIVNPQKRKVAAIGPERTRSFIQWVKANKHLL